MSVVALIWVLHSTNNSLTPVFMMMSISFFVVGRLSGLVYLNETPSLMSAPFFHLESIPATRSSNQPAKKRSSRRCGASSL